MEYKVRTEPLELQVMRILIARADLAESDRQYYRNLEKGYEGELFFDSITRQLQSNCLILNDLLLEANHSTFQIDSLIIFPNSLQVFDIKNNEGDHYFEEDKLFIKPNLEISNPVDQIKRTENRFRKWVKDHGFSFPIVVNIVFVNPRFTLYQAPMNMPFIFHSQLDRYFEQLDSHTGKLTSKHKLLADQLINSQVSKEPFIKLPTYDYGNLRKGIICEKCNKIAVAVDRGKHCLCLDCGHKELVETAVLRSVEEIKLLFPDRKITTNLVHEWCKVVPSKKRINRILEKNLKKSGKNKWVYFE